MVVFPVCDAGQLLAGQTSSGSVGGVARRLVRRHSWGGPLQMAEMELPLALQQQPPAATSMVSSPRQLEQANCMWQLPILSRL
jgi:hypothetical protein